ncbi:MAG: sulfotransferase domain-containing protein [Balneolaceae bacterium]|nr:sulfotransferase domain-containing protein [Balneolaceae bacterium]MDR9409545.1 sulfotransferase domain-containing protein [Balneolaceae bacterium]
MPPKNIVVTGLVRSGTSWIGKMISLDDSLSHTFEPFHFNHRKIYGVYKIPTLYLYLNKNDEELNKYIQDVFSHKYYYLDEILHSKSFKKFIRKLIYTIPEHLKKSILNKNALIKDPYLFFLGEYLQRNVENLKMIYTIRRPEGFVYSFLRHETWDRHPICDSLLKQPALIEDFKLGNYRDDLGKFANYELSLKANGENKIIEKEVRLKRACLICSFFARVYSKLKSKYKDEWIFLKYEEVATNPLDEFEKIYIELDLEFSEKIKNQINEFTTSNKTKSKYIVDLKRNSKDLAFYWEKKLSESEKEEIRRLTKFEYNMVYEK